MSELRARGEAIRKFILDQVSEHGADLARLVAERFEISRQAANKHLARLVKEGTLSCSGNTRQRVYSLAATAEWSGAFELEGAEGEDIIWRREIAPRIEPLPDNVRALWAYGFSEMYNNVLDHSEARAVIVSIRQTPSETEMHIHDNGIGIFRKIREALDLIDDRHAVLELAKGKLTTDPESHSGEGIFFTSRMFDTFSILSGGAYFSHQLHEQEDWLLESDSIEGTSVRMRLDNHTSRRTKQVFDQYTSGDDYGFTKTVVPVRMAQYAADDLISRSQAKRVLARVDRFHIVIFDFAGVQSIGQAFADEIFRVFATRHPEMELQAIRANEHVEQMIRRARARKAEEK